VRGFRELHIPIDEACRKNPVYRQKIVKVLTIWLKDGNRDSKRGYRKKEILKNCPKCLIPFVGLEDRIYCTTCSGELAKRKSTQYRYQKKASKKWREKESEK
jgi:hypothetical protein